LRSEQLQLDALACFRAAGDSWGQGLALGRLTETALRRHDYIRAERLALEALSTGNAAGDQALIGSAHLNLAVALLEQGRTEGASENAVEAVRTFTSVQDEDNVATAVEVLAAARARDHPREAARLLAVASIRHEALGTVAGPTEGEIAKRTAEHLRARLAAEEFDAIVADARRPNWPSLSEVVDLPPPAE
jgi:hypothetical protein